MRKRAVARRCLVAVLTLGLAACASTGEGEDAAEVSANQVSVEVNNDLVPSETVVIWMVPESGIRRRLGDVRPNGQARFAYDPGDRSLDHQLVAEVSGGGRESSRRFTLQGISTVSWNVSSPNVRVAR